MKNNQELFHLRTSIANLVDEFSKQYMNNSSWHEVWHIEWTIPYNFEFQEYYVFCLADIFTTMYYEIPKSVLLERYELRIPRQISLKNFYLEYKQNELW
jgi:hypothetical protein